MKDAIDSVDRHRNIGWIGDVAFNKVNLAADMIEIMFEARAEVVEHADFVATFHQRGNDMRTDESGSTSDKKCTHSGILRLSNAANGPTGQRVSALTV